MATLMDILKKAQAQAGTGATKAAGDLRNAQKEAAKAMKLNDDAKVSNLRREALKAQQQGKVYRDVSDRTGFIQKCLSGYFNFKLFEAVTKAPDAMDRIGYGGGYGGGFGRPGYDYGADEFGYYRPAREEDGALQQVNLEPQKMADNIAHEADQLNMKLQDSGLEPAIDKDALAADLEPMRQGAENAQDYRELAAYYGVDTSAAEQAAREGKSLDTFAAEIEQGTAQAEQAAGMEME